MSNKDNSIIRLEENGIEYFTVVATGESGLSTTGIAKSVGVHRSSISRLVTTVLESVLREDLPESLQPLWGKPLTLLRGNSYKNITIYNSSVWAAFVEYYVLDSEHPTTEAKAVLRSINRIGAESYIQGKTGVYSR